ncbi:MAG: hypothetical protein M3022_03915 [Actinomycetota bacterium]|nr:hypothetical protein [Actinomycetota bacterium]
MSSHPASASGRPVVIARRSLPAGLVAATAVTAIAGLWLTLSGTYLGTPLAPFLMSWAPHPAWPVVIGVVVSLGAAALAPWAMARIRGSVTFGAVLATGSLAVGLAVNAARTGPSGWSHVFDLGGHGSVEASREYLPALAQLHQGVHYYVGHFASLLPHLPTHTKGNPPGPVVAMHLLGITTAGRLAAVCIAATALSAPLAYLLGRELGDERRGRLAGILMIFAPAAVLFGVTSVDAVFTALGTAAAWLLVSPRVGRRAAGCALVAVASFSSWLLLAIPVWAVLVTLRREGARAAAALAVAAAGAVLLLTVVLAVLLDYDPVGILRALARMYSAGAAAHRPYVFWLFGSPAAWTAMLGLPIAWFAARALSGGDPAALALVALIVVSTVAGFTKAETERIWLPFVPLACVAAAALPIGRLRPLLGALAVQSLAVEVLFETLW